MNSKNQQTVQSLESVLNYCQKEEKTLYKGKQLVSGLNCLPQSAYSEMINTKLQYHKNGGRLFYHMVQSFSPKEKISPEEAHRFALEFAERSLKGYEVLIATHVDKKHIHSHFVINSVNADTGYKYHADSKELWRLRSESDKLCREYGLTVVKPKPKKVRDMSPREYRSADKGQSWKLQLAITISEAMKFAENREHFISLMESEGYKVKWTDERKYITYTAPNGMKCRDIKLHDRKFLKEVMEREFTIRKKILSGINGTAETEYAVGGQNRAVRNRNGGKLESSDFSDYNSEYDDRNTGKRAFNKNIGKELRGSYSTSDEYDGLGDRQSRREGINGDFEERNAGIYGKSTGSPEKTGEGKRESLTDYSEGLGQVGEEYVDTGWGYEQNVFLVYKRGDRENEGSDIRILDDSSDSNNILGDMGNYTGYLSASLIDMFDNDRPIEDCTTINKPRKERKNTLPDGPVMGGL